MKGSGFLGKALDYIILGNGDTTSLRSVAKPSPVSRRRIQQTAVLSNAALSQNSQSCSSEADVNFSVLLRQFIVNCIDFTQEM
jgi:hypothetical protein